MKFLHGDVVSFERQISAFLIINCEERGIFSYEIKIKQLFSLDFLVNCFNEDLNF